MDFPSSPSLNDEYELAGHTWVWNGYAWVTKEGVIALSEVVTFNSSGTGAASGATFDGSTPVTVSYNTVGAPSTTGDDATGTWPIDITGSAATAAVADELAPTYVVPLSQGGLGANHANVAAVRTTLGLGTLATQNATAVTITGGSVTGVTLLDDDIIAALGFTPEDSANRGAADGYAPLGSDSKIPSAFLPSYVDDVIEVANFAALPGTGETGKIYVTLSDNKIFRWSGSAYVEIVGSPGTTDAVTEGSTNLYFTEARVRSTDLAGFTTGADTPITSADDVLSAFGKVQGQIDALSGGSGLPSGGTAADYLRGDETWQPLEAAVLGIELTGLSVADATDVVTTDDILSGVGKLQAQVTAHRDAEGNVHNLVKGDIGLGDVDNTSDANKPVSTAQQAALDLKVDVADLGVADGVATLDGAGKLTAAQLPDIELTTDEVSEGSTNLYFTEARVLGTDLAGFSTAVSTDVVATDTVLVAIGKLQAQLDLGTGGVSELSDLSDVDTTGVVTDDVLKFNGTNWVPAADNDHTHAIADVTDLQTELDDLAADIAAITPASIGAIPDTEKGANNGVATLDAGGKVPSAQLPSYVDDVIEVANFAALPVTGETDKIYVTIADNKIYRWSGSVYVEIVGSPGSTDSVTEGSTNLYFTTARARASISGSGAINYDSGTGVISVDDPLGLLAVADAAAGRTALELGTMAVQDADNVNITGGIISGVVIDGGTF